MSYSRKLSIPLIFFIGIALAGAVSLIILLFNLDRQLTEQRIIFREDSVWVASQVEREARVFRDHVFRFFGDDAAITHTELSNRFDILWSRIENMDKGELGVLYLQLEGAGTVLESGKKMLRAVEPLLAGSTKGDLQKRDAILEYLNPAIDDFYDIAMKASSASFLHQERRRLNLEKTSVLTVVLITTVFISGASLFLFLLRNQRFLDQLAKTLELKVIERTSELEKSNNTLQMMSQAIAQSPVSVIICNLEGKIEYVNPQFEEVTGYSFDEAAGRNPRFLQSGQTSLEIYKEMWQYAHAGKVWKGEICNKKKNGELFWEHVSFSPIKGNRGQNTGYLAVKEDISQRKEYEDKLFKQANFDHLTGLPNRTLAMDRLRQAIRLAQRSGGQVALLFIDLDNFKEINDSLGHDYGDYVLKLAADRFVACLRDCDTAARFGGDEFLLMLTELQHRDDVMPILDRIVNEFSKPFIIDDKNFLVTASIGVSLCPVDSTDAAQLLKYSDFAMYISKKGGKNSFSFYAAHQNRN